MWLVVGLGNPGASYAGHRHNIGFMAVDAIARAHGFLSFKSRFQGLVSEGSWDGEKIVLLKPQTYMNLSGQSVGEAARYFKIAPDHILVIHDDLDVAPGKVKIKKGGGAAGHNGLKSMDQHLGTPDYWRLRLGIGHPGDRDRVHGYVLGNFSASDATWLDPLLEAVAQEGALILKGRETDFQTRLALKAGKGV